MNTTACPAAPSGLSSNGRTDRDAHARTASARAVRGHTNPQAHTVRSITAAPRRRVRANSRRRRPQESVCICRYCRGLSTCRASPRAQHVPEAAQKHNQLPTATRPSSSPNSRRAWPSQSGRRRRSARSRALAATRVRRRRRPGLATALAERPARHGQQAPRWRRDRPQARVRAPHPTRSHSCSRRSTARYWNATQGQLPPHPLICSDEHLAARCPAPATRAKTSPAAGVVR